MYEDQQGEFHHFQLVNSNGDIPFSLSVLVHYNNRANLSSELSPIETDEVIEFHDALQSFDGDFATAFSKS